MIRLHNISRIYPNSGAALDAVSLEIADRELVAISGPSGCGKTTLMHLDSATGGQITDLLQRIASQCEATMVIVTHSADVASIATRQIRMRAGHILQGHQS